MASSMVTVGLNKNEVFIKSNAAEIHTHELKFINSQKLYLNEENEIPPVVKGHKRYVQCPVFGYFENYRPIHHLLQTRLEYVWNTSILSKESTLSPEDIDKFGLLPQLSKLFNDIGVTLIYNPQ